MFDIREYYGSGRGDEYHLDHGIFEIDNDIIEDIEHLLVQRVGSHYLLDVYKINRHQIDIIYPSLGYDGPRSLMLTPDRVRFLLSLYPEKQELEKINKLVIRPRYVESGEIELASLYHKKKRVLVLYLSHPFSSDFNDKRRDDSFVSLGLEHLMNDKVIGDSIGASRTAGGKPLLWSIISSIDPEGDGEMDKFLVRRKDVDPAVFRALSDISYHYGNNGY